MDWLNSKLIKKSEVARMMGLKWGTFMSKLKKEKYNKFNTIELEKLESIKKELNDLTK